MKFLFSLITIFTISLSLSGQQQLDLSFWSDVMINANSAENRILALDQFQKSFDQIIEDGNAFEFDFSTTPELTVLSDSLNNFKIVTWQVQKSETSYGYYGYVLHKDGKTFKLNDAYNTLDDIDYLTLDNEEWLGGIYYNMIQMGGKNYLFSYRQLDQFTKFKSFDVLSFDEDGRPSLGEEVFVIPNKDTRDVVKNRITFTYSADAILSLNYNVQMKMVVNDHLMQVMGQLEGQGPTMVPDGTYEGYIYKEGKWVYEEKLFSHTYDEAPRPNQILGKSNKDVFGNERKN
ncbi:hypothetical protein [Portibacter lacus]|uniref:Uncharacterized protein n=1 Tax=Portibacter lacus TaxID=1099794 RepID=A0AA37SPH8_9BACT|nr:hypothetical protein [Portibacter lacus]GLR16368.1 hypothetical protein GCM10007940_09830 [Portibacter lacus]